MFFLLQGVTGRKHPCVHGGCFQEKDPAQGYLAREKQPPRRTLQ